MLTMLGTGAGGADGLGRLGGPGAGSPGIGGLGQSDATRGMPDLSAPTVGTVGAPQVLRPDRRGAPSLGMLRGQGPTTQPAEPLRGQRPGPVRDALPGTGDAYRDAPPPGPVPLTSPVPPERPPRIHPLRTEHR